MRIRATALGLAIITSLHATPALAADPPAKATDESTVGPYWLFPSIVMGVGAVLATSGIVYYLTANQHYPDSCSPSTQVCTTNYYHSIGITDAQGAGWRVALDRDKQDEYNRHHRIGFGLTVMGATGMAAGLVWLLLAKPSRPSTAITPWVDVGRGGLMLRSTF